MENKRKAFEEPDLVITKLMITDVITTSSGETDDEDWGLGEF